MMYIGLHRNKEIYKRINVSKIANNISTLGNNSTTKGGNSRLIMFSILAVASRGTGVDSNKFQSGTFALFRI